MAASRTGKPRAIVFGGSMGGLFIGNMLIRQGWDVDIYERSSESLALRGAGIAGHPEMAPVLRACGIDQDRIPGVDVDGRTAFDRSGRQIGYFAHAQYLTGWGLLHDLLRARFPVERYHAGVGLDTIERTGPSPRVGLSDGRRIEADLVIGADGVRARSRALLAPEVEPAYAGYVAFRGSVPEADLSETFRREMFHRYIWLLCGDGQLNGYPISGPGTRTEPGHRQYVYLWYKPVDADELDNLLTDAAGTRHPHTIPPPLIRPEHFARLEALAARIMPPLPAEIVAKATTKLLQPIVDVLSTRIAFDHIALLGDAAFVARPHIGTGILKAGQDALALARCLAAADDIATALTAYQRERVPAGRRSVLVSRHLGSFIERRLPTPEADPGLGLSTQLLLRASARPVESTLPDFPI